MKIIDLKTTVLSIPLEKPFSHQAARNRINPIIVHLFSDEGIEGIGLAFTWNDEVDGQRVGGITEFMKVAAMAQAWHRPIASHLFHDFSVHLIAAIPNGLFVEYMPWWDVIYAEPLQVKDGMMSVPEVPGWGLKLNPLALKKYAWS